MPKYCSLYISAKVPQIAIYYLNGTKYIVYGVSTNLKPYPLSAKNVTTMHCGVISYLNRTNNLNHSFYANRHLNKY